MLPEQARFSRDLTADEQRDYLAWCEKHRVTPIRGTLTDDERAENARLERQAYERLEQSPTWRALPPALKAQFFSRARPSGN